MVDEKDLNFQIHEGSCLFSYFRLSLIWGNCPSVRIRSPTKEFAHNLIRQRDLFRWCVRFLRFGGNDFGLLD